MNTTRPAALTMAGILMIICGAASTAQSKIDISGTWVFTMQNAAGSVPAQVTMKIDGGRLTGHITSTISAISRSSASWTARASSLPSTATRVR